MVGEPRTTGGGPYGTVHRVHLLGLYDHDHRWVRIDLGGKEERRQGNRGSRSELGHWRGGPGTGNSPIAQQFSLEHFGRHWPADYNGDSSLHQLRTKCVNTPYRYQLGRGCARVSSGCAVYEDEARAVPTSVVSRLHSHAAHVEFLIPFSDK